MKNIKNSYKQINASKVNLKTADGLVVLKGHAAITKVKWHKQLLICLTT
jgi:hypothetical protein